MGWTLSQNSPRNKNVNKTSPRLDYYTEFSDSTTHDGALISRLNAYMHADKNIQKRTRLRALPLFATRKYTHCFPSNEWVSVVDTRKNATKKVVQKKRKFVWAKFSNKDIIQAKLDFLAQKL